MNEEVVLEYVLERNQIEDLLSELDRLLSYVNHYQFKIRFTDELIVIIPYTSPVEIKCPKQ